MKQVIIANKSLNMSPGKLAAMVAHGSTAFLTAWFKEYTDISFEIQTPDKRYDYGYGMFDDANIDRTTFSEWINGSFTKIVLEANQDEMENIIRAAQENHMYNGEDFFNIVDESTEFENIPRWAVIAFRPMESEEIDPITGHLNLYGKEDSSLDNQVETWT